MSNKTINYDNEEEYEDDFLDLLDLELDFELEEEVTSSLVFSSSGFVLYVQPPNI